MAALVEASGEKPGAKWCRSRCTLVLELDEDLREERRHLLLLDLLDVLMTSMPGAGERMGRGGQFGF